MHNLLLILGLGVATISTTLTAAPLEDPNNHVFDKRAKLLYENTVTLAKSNPGASPTIALVPRWAAHTLMLVIEKSWSLRAVEPNYRGTQFNDDETDISVQIVADHPDQSYYTSQIQSYICIAAFKEMMSDLLLLGQHADWEPRDYDVFIDAAEIKWGSLTMAVAQYEFAGTMKHLSNSTLNMTIERSETVNDSLSDHFHQDSLYNNSTKLNSSSKKSKNQYEMKYETIHQERNLQRLTCIALIWKALQDGVWAASTALNTIKRHLRVGQVILDVTVDGIRLVVWSQAVKIRNHEYNYEDISQALRGLVFELSNEGIINVLVKDPGSSPERWRKFLMVQVGPGNKMLSEDKVSSNISILK